MPESFLAKVNPANPAPMMTSLGFVLWGMLSGTVGGDLQYQWLSRRECSFQLTINKIMETNHQS
ncbi:MAG: hypothetical protein IPF46_14580 [Saprospiraceae bacterium]|nr:hypothetical protein [Candidatus Vicinibacter affinis]